MNIGRLLGIVIMALSLISLIVLSVDIPSQGTKDVSCYDRYSNKIVGEQCQQVTDETDIVLYLFCVICLSGILFLVGFTIYKLGKYEEETAKDEFGYYENGVWY